MPFAYPLSVKTFLNTMYCINIFDTISRNAFKLNRLELLKSNKEIVIIGHGGAVVGTVAS